MRTQYFHALANGRKNTNAIHAISDDDGTAVSAALLPQYVHNYFNNLLGRTKANFEIFSLVGKVGPSLADELSTLDDPINEAEVKEAINAMPANKASGPNGLPIKLFWAQEIKPDFHIGLQAHKCHQHDSQNSHKNYGKQASASP